MDLSEGLPEHVGENRRWWDADAGNWVAGGERHWAQTEPTWGMWAVPRAELLDEPGGSEFNLTVSGWFRLFKDAGFAIDDFIEVQAPDRGDEVRYFATADWSNDHPSEQAWMLTKR